MQYSGIEDEYEIYISHQSWTRNAISLNRVHGQ